ncbi:MAG TPA: flagellar basal-body rod protein FlgG [Clostridia bacterium]|jgi:flagellar basal-body rod protein FlgG|nr:flagellar basal-body rod protein FlgG [Clostridia bacterium]
MRALWTASTGMYAQQFNMDNIANNLANVNTVGYKKSRVEFQELLYETIRQPVANGPGYNPVGLMVGHGVRTVCNTRQFSQGTPQQTDLPTDLMIDGEGFFILLTPDGEEVYTRDGSFKIDGEGNWVNSNGYMLATPLDQVPPEVKEISIDESGLVLALVEGEEEPVELGQLELARFVNPAGLKSLGDNLYAETVASGPPIIGIPGEEGLGKIRQGYLELSNVKVVEEMVNMIMAQRAYEINSKVIQASDEMLGLANNLRR